MRFSESSNLTSVRFLPALAVVIVFISLCLGLGHLPLMQPDEGRNAEVAREMKESGAWLVPTYNGVDYLDKPAFYFKAVALSLAAFGDNETAARLPSALFGVALVAMVFVFCRKFYASQRVAWLATIVVSTMPLYLVNSRLVIFDIALTFFVCGAVFAGFLAEEAEGRARRNWYLLGAVAAGLATLVKGPVGFVLPILVFLVSQRMAGRRGVWKRLFAPLNLLVFFAVTLPWFIGLCFAKRDFFHYGIVDETFKRFTSAAKFKRGKPFYYYPLLVAVTFLPWSLLLPGATIAAWRSRWVKHRADCLCIVWSVLAVLFFSVSQSKQPGYILSVPVACGILIARLIDAALTNPAGRAARVMRHAVMAFVAMCLAALSFVLWGAWRLESFAKLARMTLENAQSWQAHVWPLAIFLGAFASFGVIALLRRSPWLGFLGLATFVPLFMIVNIGGLKLALQDKSGRTMAEIITLKRLPPETELASLECEINGASFYLGKTVTLISADGQELRSNYIPYRLAQSTQWPPTIVREAELFSWLASRKTPVYLLVRTKDQQRLQSIAEARGVAIETLTERYYGALLPPAGGGAPLR